MGIFFGIAAALGFGSADFLARFSSRLIGTYRTLFFMQFIGFFGLSLYLALSGEFGRLVNGQYWQAWGWALLATLLNTASYLALYRAFEIGLLVVVSPLVSSYAAVTVVLSVLSGEKLTLSHGIGIGTVLIGVLLAVTPPGQLRSNRVYGPTSPAGRTFTPGIGWAFAASLGFGIIYWLLGFYITPVLGGIAPTWLFRLAPICLLAPLSALTHQSLRLPRGYAWWLIIGVGILDTAAIIAGMLGLATGQVAIVSVLSSLYSVVTIVLAWLFLREKLHWSQWLGIIIILGGIVLVNL
jgi:drug/metabolite transporter (DMT)-like permease